MLPRGQPASPSVLLVDDNVDLLEGLQEVFEGEGWRVRTACNGRDALDVLHQGPVPDVIVLDLMMPVMAGPEFLAARRGVEQLRAIPVVVVSAAAEELGVAVRSDVHAVLLKPVPIPTMLKVVADAVLEPA
ncbi:MAG: response regulator [Myxococcota bacterium]